MSRKSMLHHGLAAALCAVALCNAGACVAEVDDIDEPAVEEDEQTAEAEQELSVCSSCPASMVGYRGQNGFQLECSCPSVSSGSVWGTDLYTDDSSLCRTAVHAGAITAAGGVIVATVHPGASGYTGSTRNGVASSSYGAWVGSYSVAAGSPCVMPCPGSLTSYRGQNGTVVTCHCSSAATAGGGVWGTGTYTDDSSLCRAALHAGAVTTAGGVISAVISGGRSSYTGSTSNGVTSSSYGSWVGSYSF